MKIGKLIGAYFVAWLAFWAILIYLVITRVVPVVQHFIQKYW